MNWTVEGTEPAGGVTMEPANPVQAETVGESCPVVAELIVPSGALPDLGLPETVEFCIDRWSASTSMFPAGVLVRWGEDLRQLNQAGTYTASIRRNAHGGRSRTPVEILADTYLPPGLRLDGTDQRRLASSSTARSRSIRRSSPPGRGGPATTTPTVLAAMPRRCRPPAELFFVRDGRQLCHQIGPRIRRRMGDGHGEHPRPLHISSVVAAFLHTPAEASPLSERRTPVVRRPSASTEPTMTDDDSSPVDPAATRIGGGGLWGVPCSMPIRTSPPTWWCPTSCFHRRSCRARHRPTSPISGSTAPPTWWGCSPCWRWCPFGGRPQGGR